MELLKLYKDGCKPCELVSMFLKSKYVQATEIDVYDRPDQAMKYGIMSVPVVILLDDDSNEVRRSTGFVQSELEEIINQITQ